MPKKKQKQFLRCAAQGSRNKDASCVDQDEICRLDIRYPYSCGAYHKQQKVISDADKCSSYASNPAVQC